MLITKAHIALTKATHCVALITLRMIVLLNIPEVNQMSYSLNVGILFSIVSIGHKQCISSILPSPTATLHKGNKGVKAMLGHFIIC